MIERRGSRRYCVTSSAVPVGNGKSRLNVRDDPLIRYGNAAMDGKRCDVREVWRHINNLRSDPSIGDRG
jgi:hypothetical protein